MQFFDDQLVATTQGRLADLGWYKGKVDGDEGPMTENALARFKAAHGMRERPYPGPLTMATLWGSAAKVAPAPVVTSGEPSWLAEARSLLGTREVRGAGNSATIMKWARDLDQWYTGDDVPWCGLFVAHCMSVGAPDEPQDFNRLGARAWLEFGEDCGAKMGAVAVFWRTHKTRSWNGHVAILTGESDTAYRVIGGNQSDNVTETWIAKSRILGFRAPVGWSGSKAPTASTGQLSTNEA